MKKNILNSLLRTYSTVEIGNIFSKIDSRINNIHEYSSKDFLKLNSEFKKYYTDAKEISNNAISMFSSFEKSSFNIHYNAFIKHYEIIFTETNTFLESLQEKLIYIEEFHKRFKSLKIPFSNLLQNLMTVKLLATSLVTENLTSDKTNASAQIQNTLLKIDELIYVIRILDSRNNDIKSEFGILNQNIKNNLQIQIKTHLP